MSVTTPKTSDRKNQKPAVRELKALRVSTDSKARAAAGCACTCAINCGGCYCNPGCATQTA